MSAKRPSAWAKHHLEELRPQIEAFEQRDSHTITCEVDADAGIYRFYVSGIEAVDPDWGLRIGDCLNNARSALDFLMVRLVALAEWKDPMDVRDGFPIAETPKEFRVRNELRELLPFAGYLTRIKELQPFNAGNQSIWGRGHGAPHFKVMRTLPEALRRLSQLNNLDKHRVLHPVWIGAHLPDIRRAVENYGFPDEFVARSKKPGIDPDDAHIISAQFEMGPFVDGAKIATLYFETPLPFAWEPSEVNMKRYFSLKVSFAQPEEIAIYQGVLEQLAFCLWGVEAVLDMFEPVFIHGDPPLPVTTSLAELHRPKPPKA